MCRSLEAGQSTAYLKDLEKVREGGRGTLQSS